ncbi:hypothetical protein ACF1BQ_020990 [Bradyrhizobium sp. RDT10]
MNALAQPVNRRLTTFQNSGTGGLEQPAQLLLMNVLFAPARY